MNKRQKEKSREIRDIMRTDKWSRMTYKEAKGCWRNGIRAYKVGDLWIANDLASLGFSRSNLLELGRVHHKLLKYAAERHLRFSCGYEPRLDAFEMRFYGRAVDGDVYTVSHTISGDTLRKYRGSLMDTADRVLDKVNRRLQEFVFPSVVTKPVEIESLHPRIMIHDWKLQNPEEVFAKIIEKEE